MKLEEAQVLIFISAKYGMKTEAIAKEIAVTSCTNCS